MIIRDRKIVISGYIYEDDKEILDHLKNEEGISFNKLLREIINDYLVGRGFSSLEREKRRKWRK